MHINSRNELKKLLHSIEYDKFFILEEDVCINYDGNTFTE